MKRATITILALALVACAGGRDAVLSRTSIGLQAARAAAEVEDERLQTATIIEAERDQREILAAGTSGAEVRAAVAARRQARDAELAAHRRSRDTATRIYQAACGALAAAALDPSDLNMARLAQLGLAAYQALKGGGVL